MKNKTDITIILDRSGSMESVKSDTIGGFNSFLGEQQKIEGEAVLTLVQFDDQYEVVYLDKEIARADKLSTETFVPRGMTALYDAIGRTINETGKRLADLPEAERPDKVLMVIMTDGEENSSQEFRSETIGQMIREQRDKYNWQFMFIGANQDAILNAHEIGIPMQAALTYTANAKGTQAAFGSVAKRVANYRLMNDAAALQFDDEDREKQKKAGN